MIYLSSSSRQPTREAWTLDRLNAELTINLGMAIDRSTYANYTSALNSYITFCRLYGFDIEPTQRTLALCYFQINIYQPKICRHIFVWHIQSASNALSRDVRLARRSALVSRALQDAK